MLQPPSLGVFHPPLKTKQEQAVYHGTTAAPSKVLQRAGAACAWRIVPWSIEEAEGGVVHQSLPWSLQLSQEGIHHPKSLQERANKWWFGDYQCTSQTYNTSIVFISICNFNSYAVFITLVNFHAYLVCTPYSYQANYYILVFHLHIFQIKAYQFSLPQTGGRNKANNSVKMEAN